MSHPKRVLDLFCGAGGAAMGLHRAWPEADILGVDIIPQPRYPFRFVRADAMTFPLEDYDFIWASPPCQKFSPTRTLHKREYPDLVKPIRERINGTPYCIENVNGAPLLRGAVMLCGQMFGLKVFRHRWFESRQILLAPSHAQHDGNCDAPVSKSRGGGGTRFGGKNGYVTVAGNNFNRQVGMMAMGIDWEVTQHECAEAVPPAYSEYIARQFS